MSLRYPVSNRGGGVPEVPLSGRREEDLVARAVGGDDGAFTELYDLHYDRVYRHVCYRVGRSQDAEDLTQQVFLQAWRALRRYRPTGAPFVAWLLTIAHNAVISFYRRTKSMASLETDVGEPVSDHRMERVTELLLEHEGVRTAMQLLKPEQQLVLSMRFLDDLEYRDIAATLGKTEGNVRVIQHRALQELRRILERHRA